MPAVTAQALIEAAVALGYDALSHRDLLECLLYATTQASGGGGGSVQLIQGNADPVAAPDDPTKPALYTNRTSGVQFFWNTVSLAWE